MQVVICPGLHETRLTEAFIAEMSNYLNECRVEPIVYPTDRYPPYSPQHLLSFLHSALAPSSSASSMALYKDLCHTSLFFIGFSAGAVGAIGAARLWHRQGGRVAALVAIDGWGVPLYGDFPIYRISHDLFTHWSSAALGAGKESFYADPPVSHLDLWRSPQTTQGWWVRSSRNRTATDRTTTTAAQILLTWLRYHGE
jgi:hypothetical protein